MITADDPVSTIHALDRACNGHDLEAVLELFTEDAVVRHTPAPDCVGIYQGKEQISGWLALLLPGFHVDSWGHRVAGETVRWSASVMADVLRQLGQHQPTTDHNGALVREGKIISFTVTSQTNIP